MVKKIEKQRKTKKIHIVKNGFYSVVKKEQENYRMRELHGISINQPIDGFDHFWAASRYAHMAFNSPEEIIETTSQEVLSQFSM